MKKCPFCAEAIKDEAIVCRYCGKDLTGEMWYVAIDGNKIGPMAKDVLVARLESGEYPVDTASVWTEEQAEWAPASSLNIQTVAATPPKEVSRQKSSYQVTGPTLTHYAVGCGGLLLGMMFLGWCMGGQGIPP